MKKPILILCVATALLLAMACNNPKSVSGPPGGTHSTGFVSMTLLSNSNSFVLTPGGGGGDVIDLRIEVSDNAVDDIDLTIFYIYSGLSDYPTLSSNNSDTDTITTASGFYDLSVTIGTIPCDAWGWYRLEAKLTRGVVPDEISFVATFDFFVTLQPASIATVTVTGDCDATPDDVAVTGTNFCSNGSLTLDGAPAGISFTDNSAFTYTSTVNAGGSVEVEYRQPDYNITFNSAIGTMVCPDVP